MQCLINNICCQNVCVCVFNKLLVRQIGAQTAVVRQIGAQTAVVSVKCYDVDNHMFSLL